MVRQGSPERSRQAHHERNQTLAVRPELVEGLDQRFPSYLLRVFAARRAREKFCPAAPANRGPWSSRQRTAGDESNAANRPATPARARRPMRAARRATGNAPRGPITTRLHALATAASPAQTARLGAAAAVSLPGGLILKARTVLQQCRRSRAARVRV